MTQRRGEATHGAVQPASVPDLGAFLPCGQTRPLRSGPRPQRRCCPQRKPTHSAFRPPSRPRWTAPPHGAAQLPASDSLRRPAASSRAGMCPARAGAGAQKRADPEAPAPTRPACPRPRPGPCAAGAAFRGRAHGSGGPRCPPRRHRRGPDQTSELAVAEHPCSQLVGAPGALPGYKLARCPELRRSRTSTVRGHKRRSVDVANSAGRRSGRRPHCAAPLKPQCNAAAQNVP